MQISTRAECTVFSVAYYYQCTVKGDMSMRAKDTTRGFERPTLALFLVRKRWNQSSSSDLSSCWSRCLCLSHCNCIQTGEARVSWRAEIDRTEVTRTQRGASHQIPPLLWAMLLTSVVTFYTITTFHNRRRGGGVCVWYLALPYITDVTLWFIVDEIDGPKW
jgi:hypothetical protein